MMGAYTDFQGKLQAYMQANPIEGSVGDYSLPLTDRASQPSLGIPADKQYQDWRGTLSPTDLASYDSSVAGHYKKGTDQNRRKFAAAMAAMGGGAYLAAEGAGSLGGAAASAAPEAGATGGATAFPVYGGAMPAFTDISAELAAGAAGGAAATGATATLPPVSVSGTALTPTPAFDPMNLAPLAPAAANAMNNPIADTAPQASPQGVDPNPPPDTSFGSPSYNAPLGYSPGADITTTGVPSGGSSGGSLEDAMSNWEGGPQGDMSQTYVPDATTEPSSVDKALKALGVKDIGSAISKYGPAVGTLASMLKQRGSGQGAQSQFNAIAKPVSDTSNQLLAQFNKGQITGADQYKIQQHAQEQTAAVNSYYAKAGLSNSSMHLQALDKVQQDAEGMRQQALQNMLNEGLRAAGVADPYLAQGIRASLAQDQQAQSNMAAFMQQLARMNTPTPTPTGTPGP